MTLASIHQKTPASKSPARILGLNARLGIDHAPRLRDLLLRTLASRRFSQGLPSAVIIIGEINENCKL
jgi:hypothetical protein